MKDSSEKEHTAHAALAIQTWMILRLSEALGINPVQIDPRDPLVSYGLDSLTAFTLTGDLADWLGFDLPATLFWEYPTLEALAQFLGERIGDVNAASLQVNDVRRALGEIERLNENEAQTALIKIRK